METTSKILLRFINGDSSVLSLDELIQLSETPDTKILDRGVYGEDLWSISAILANPFLTTEHCKYLMQIFCNPQVNEGARALIVAHSNFPSDMLAELALDDPAQAVLDIVAIHPNATEESRITAVLRNSERSLDLGSMASFVRARSLLPN